MRVGTYPTRDFATLGILLLPGIDLAVSTGWAGHFCRPLHVAMQIGPYLPAGSVQRVRRMVSEDSGDTCSADNVQVKQTRVRPTRQCLFYRRI